jgi:type I restriction enzyme S subunit
MSEALRRRHASSAAWPLRPLGDLCDVLDYMRRPITRSARETGQYPYFGATGILDYVSRYLFDEPLVLVGEDGAKWKSGDQTAFVVTGKFWVNNHAHVLRPHRSELLDDWLAYCLRTLDLSEFVTGITVPKLTQRRLREIPIPLPPLSEQERIIRLLDEADALRKLRAEADRRMADFIPALFHEMFGDPVTNPKGWQVKRLGEVTEIVGGGTPSKTIPTYWDGDVVWVTPSDLPPLGTGPVGIEDGARRLTAAGVEGSSATLLPAGTILFSSRATIGKIAIATTTLTTNQGFVNLTPGPKVLSRFLAQLLFECREALECLSSSTTFREVGRGAVRGFPVPIPPLTHQKRFEALATAAEDVFAIARKTTIRSATLFQALLQRAFQDDL